MTANVNVFAGACIHHLFTIGGTRFLWLYGRVVHGAAPKELLQFEVLELGPASTVDVYLVRFRDDHSSCIRLFSIDTISSSNAAHAIVNYFAALEAPRMLTLKRPTDFKSKMVRHGTTSLQTKHHFILP